MLVAFESNDLHLFRFRDAQLCIVKNEAAYDHDQKVTCLDRHPKLGFFASGGEDGLVKVWNSKKELIREIKFPEQVNAVSFLNERGDLIIGHMNKVSTVSIDDYQPFELPKLCHFSDSELKEFFDQRCHQITEDLFLGMKQKEDSSKNKKAQVQSEE